MSEEFNSELQPRQHFSPDMEDAKVNLAADRAWARSFYLGQNILSDCVRSDMVGDVVLDANDLRKRIFNSEPHTPYRHILARPYPTTFVSWLPNSPKICVLGNCQGPNLAKAMAAVCRRPISVCGIEIMNYSSQPDAFEQIFDEADIIVACKTYSKEFESISSEVLSARHPGKVLEYSPVYFAGLHPDIVYLGARGSRVYSPLGDYNSRIALSSYLNGYSPEDAVSLYNRDLYEYHGYFSIFSTSETEFRRREALLSGNSVKFADLFFSLVRENPVLYSVNHPTSSLLIEMACLILREVGFKSTQTSPDLFANSLSDNVIWPVPPEIQEVHGLRYASGSHFLLNQSMISLQEFVWRSHQIYSMTDRDLLNTCADEADINRDLGGK